MSAVQAMQQAGTAIYKLDDMEFGRRLAVERELEKDSSAGATMNVIWDESGNFLLYPSMLGIKGTIDWRGYYPHSLNRPVPLFRASVP